MKFPLDLFFSEPGDWKVATPTRVVKYRRIKSDDEWFESRRRQAKSGSRERPIGLGLAALLDELADRGVGFRSLTEGIDTATPMGRLMFHVIASVAEMEQELIRERTKAGRPRALEPHDVELVRRRRAEGWTLDAIAADRKASRSTIIRALDIDDAAEL